MADEFNNIPASVRIPFPNPISEQYKIIPGPIAAEQAGGGRHYYEVMAFGLNGVRDYQAEITFQKGPLPETGHNGLLSTVLLTILTDHLNSFQSGQFASVETDQAIQHLEEAMHWLARRADERAGRGVLGQHKA